MILSIRLGRSAVLLAFAACARSGSSGDLASLADSAFAGRVPRCSPAHFVALVSVDEPSPATVCSAGTGAEADTMVLVDYDSAQRVLSVTRLWRSERPETDLVQLVRGLASDLGAAIACPTRDSDGVRQYVWRTAEPFVSLNRLRPDSTLGWTVSRSPYGCAPSPA